MRARKGTSYKVFLTLTGVPTDICVPWPYAKDSSGYGNMKYLGGVISTHRLSCQRHHGPPPTPDHEAAHSCHNRACINPRHLRWATRAENQQDRVKDGTSSRGEHRGRTTMTPDKVRELRRLMAGGMYAKEAAAIFGISRRSASSIYARDSWASLDPC